MTTGISLLRGKKIILNLFLCPSPKSIWAKIIQRSLNFICLRVPDYIAPIKVKQHWWVPTSYISKPLLFCFLCVGVKGSEQKKDLNYHNSTQIYTFKGLLPVVMHWINQQARELTLICYIFHNTCLSRICSSFRDFVVKQLRHNTGPSLSLVKYLPFYLKYLWI